MMTKGLAKSTKQKKKKVIFSFLNWLGFHILGPWQTSSAGPDTVGFRAMFVNQLSVNPDLWTCSWGLRAFLVGFFSSVVSADNLKTNIQPITSSG